MKKNKILSRANHLVSQFPTASGSLYSSDMAQTWNIYRQNIQYSINLINLEMMKEYSHVRQAYAIRLSIENIREMFFRRAEETKWSILFSMSLFVSELNRKRLLGARLPTINQPWGKIRKSRWHFWTYIIIHVTAKYLSELGQCFEILMRCNTRLTIWRNRNIHSEPEPRG